MDEKKSMHSANDEYSEVNSDKLKIESTDFVIMIRIEMNTAKSPVKLINLKGRVDVETIPSTATENKEKKLFVDLPVSLSGAL